MDSYCILLTHPPCPVAVAAHPDRQPARGRAPTDASAARTTAGQRGVGGVAGWAAASAGGAGPPYSHYHDLGMLFQVSLPDSNETLCMLNPPARAHTVAPHCGSPLPPAARVFNTAVSVATGRFLPPGGPHGVRTLLARRLLHAARGHRRPAARSEQNPRPALCRAHS